MGKIINNDCLDSKFGIYGYEIGNNIIDLDDLLLDIYKMLANINYNIKSKLWFCTKNGLVSNAKKILNNYFDLHDVVYLPEKICNNACFLLDFGLVDSRSLSENLSFLAKTISPYDIPIKYDCDSITQQSIILDTLYYNSINVNKKNSKSVIIEYIHELGHVQLNNQNGVIADYHNREVISIFLEKLSALMLDDSENLLRNIQLSRYQDLLKCFEFLNNENVDDMYKLEASVYVVSSLKAEQVFGLYLNNDGKFRERMLLSIQNIFDGKQTVEDFLEKYDVDFENSKDKNILKRQLKV